MFRLIPRLVPPQRRASDRKTAPALEGLETRHMPAVSVFVPAGVVKAPPTAAGAEVGILFPVFRLAAVTATKSEASLAWTRFPDFISPADYTNPCFVWG